MSPKLPNRAKVNTHNISLFKTGVILSLVALLCINIVQPIDIMSLVLIGQKNAPTMPSTLGAQVVNTAVSQSVTDPSIGTLEPAKQMPVQPHEIVSERTATTNTYVNSDGSKTMTYSPVAKNYETNGEWEPLNPTTKSVDYKSTSQVEYNKPNPIAANGLDFAQKQNLLTINPIASVQPQAYELSTGDLKATLKPFSDGISVKYKDKTISLRPISSKNVAPVTETIDQTDITIYKNAWQNVDVEYELRGASLKETLILNNQSAATDFTYKVEGGVKIIPHPTITGALAIEGVDPNEFYISQLSVNVNNRGIISDQTANWTIDGDVLHLSIDKTWFSSLTKSDFPVAIDPSFVANVGGALGNFYAFKSDGYGCNSTICDVNVGMLNDAGRWKSWRTAFYIPVNQLAGKKFMGASLHLLKRQGNYYTGINDNRYIYNSWASCIGFNCIGPGTSVGLVGSNNWIDISNTIRTVANYGGIGNAWYILSGEESPGYTSFKTINPVYLEMSVDYDTPTPITTAVEPADGQVIVNTQPTLRVNPVGDADGDNVQYYFRVSANPNAESGAVINSGWINSTQWTVPDGILQDGTTYYWHTYTMGRTQTDPNWIRSFKVDLRTGKDNTQSYQTVGPIGVDLATGNATTGTSTHSMSALGGNIGLSMNYDSPSSVKKGLIGQYWNVGSGYGFGTVPSSEPNLTRNDQNINFAFSTGSPGGNVQNDWFYVRWKGNFVAPVTGSYYFGASNDDAVSIKVNGQSFAAGCYGSTPCFASNSITLQAGQSVPLVVEYEEATGDGYVRLFVKGTVAQQIVPADWLQTEAMSIPAQYGLNGRYYSDNGTHDITSAASDPMRLMMARNDVAVSFNWGTDAPAAGLQTDNFMVRWTGYITVPTDGNYTIGATSDDGVRVKLNNGPLGAEQTVLNTWQDQGATTTWGSATYLKAGQPVPITVDYYEKTGPAVMNLIVKDVNSIAQSMPNKWLTPKASALPGSWQLSASVDGSIAYERIKITGSNVSLIDVNRVEHDYAWTGSGFKPPVNEDGNLVRNSDNTYTLIDTDGRVYIFNAEGNLASLTTPSDDRQPTALKYEYSGNPSRLIKITDGVNSSRYGTLHYRGINEDGNCAVPNNYEAAPSGMLCAFKTSDGNTTKLYYKSGQLSRVERPGNDLNDFSYDGIGRIVGIRDTLANDAIIANVRVDDVNMLTSISYDNLGRVSDIKSPAPTTGGARIANSFEYLISSTKLHTTDAPEPYGFSKKVDYDSLLRTTKTTDMTNNSSSIEWDSVKDLVLSSTNSLGLKSTTIYDDMDRSIESYGPASSAWFGSDRRPLSAYASQIPKTTTGYDENILGLAVEYMAANAPVMNNSLSNGQVLYKNQSLYSLDRRFQLAYQSDGNVVLYGPNGVMWHTVTSNKASDRLVMQGDGNLVLYNGATAVWCSGAAAGTTSARLIIQNDGNLVIYRAGAGPWSTNTGGWLSAGSASVGLTGAPLLYGTNITSDNTTIGNNFGTTSPIPGRTGSWGMRMIGKMRLPTVGNWNFRIASDSGVRVWIDDVLVLDDWVNDYQRSHPSFTFNNTAVNGLHRIRIDYYHSSDVASFNLFATAPGAAETSATAKYFSPGYSLNTSNTSYDSQLGNTTSTTTYSRPEYGLVSRTTIDPTGIALQNQASYEAPGTGYLRQTSRTMPAGGAYKYIYYSATEAVDNPCTVAVDPAVQAGRAKGKTEPDPDGTGPQTGRSTETVYDFSGRVVATRYNTDPWTCMTYDARGRIMSTTIPAIDSAAGRIISNNYAVGGNPLVTSTSDSSGIITVETDLLGHTIKYIDALGKMTTNVYDNFGKLLTKTSINGTEAYTYDQYDRLTTYKLDGVTFATVTYDQYNRIQSAQYPAGLSLQPAERDQLGRVSKVTYKAGSETISDQISRSVSGIITSGTENGVAKNYTYDSIGRLTGATIGTNTFSYSFGASDFSCGMSTGNNSNAGKNSNRTKLTVNGQVTTYCYDSADRLITSSDALYSQVTYDNHGNTVRMGSNADRTEFTYDSSDRNIGITETTATSVKSIAYTRDSSGRIISRVDKENGVVKSTEYYGFSGSGSSPDFVLDGSGKTTQKFIGLPGGVQVTIKPQSTSASMVTYSLSNMHGDTMATVNADGMLTGKYMTGPFGESLPNQLIAKNATIDTTYGYVGTYLKSTESSLAIAPIQMGARVYVPGLGRFLQVDPVEGGTMNSYVYATDPVGSNDINGMFLGLAVSGITLLCVSAAALITTVFVTNPKVQEAAHNLATTMNTTMSQAINNVRSETKSETIATTKSTTVPTTKKNCPSYTPAPGLPTFGINTERVLNSPVANKTSIIVGSIIAALTTGNKPGVKLPIYFDDTRYINGGDLWHKYAIAGKSGNDFHYSINENKCWYADIKDKSLDI